ncbi:3-methyl-2-oxobutanoate hydroxymethyltransferase [Telmatocola sphagniphila]|uniref:3-methyl-2-oxobutanoate hydroxymethyltransferase n=2 Tax=Telmatocola sphagniphila TaxID=1123043 RepID=A0A8E6BBM0_9BACT|nr:3-methyl-2-oxobutanoate hydroxymethyltransferase [Telmatocola sphagniphila]
MTVPDFLTAKKAGRKLSVLTAYDYTTGLLLDSSGVDALLVGDSLGMVMQGNDNPLAVTLEESLYHTRCVSRAARRALVIGDLPFLTYQTSAEQAIISAGRMLKEAGAQAVKLEGGIRCAEAIRRIVECDIPVMGHVGMTPQSVHAFGGFKVQRNEAKILEDALAVEQAGAFAVVLECIPSPLGEEITKKLTIPTIGIGAGPNCDGQVLVVQDMLGMFDEVRPKFVKRYADLGSAIRQAAEKFREEVRDGVFPSPEYSFK